MPITGVKRDTDRLNPIFLILKNVTEASGIDNIIREAFSTALDKTA